MFPRSWQFCLMSGNAEPLANVHGLLFPLRTCDLEYMSCCLVPQCLCTTSGCDWLCTNNIEKEFESFWGYIQFILFKFHKHSWCLYFRDVDGGGIAMILLLAGLCCYSCGFRKTPCREESEKDFFEESYNKEGASRIKLNAFCAL